MSQELAEPPNGQTSVELRRSGWTLETLAFHNAALRTAQDKFEVERDRRYAEVAVEREKALKIKETADLAALQLARELQTYKDEKANNLRSQIESERGSYATHAEMTALGTRLELTLNPVKEYMIASQGRERGFSAVWAGIFSLVSLLIALGVLVVNVLSHQVPSV